MATEPHSALQNIISDNWNSSNTDDTTPEIKIITDQLRIDKNTNRDWILIHRVVPEVKPAGVGVFKKNVGSKMKVDVRTFGQQNTKSDDITHYNKVLGELDRVLDSKINSPEQGYTYMDPDGRGPDLSDKMHYIYRSIFEVTLWELAKSRPSQV